MSCRHAFPRYAHEEPLDRLWRYVARLCVPERGQRPDKAAASIRDCLRRCDVLS